MGSAFLYTFSGSLSSTLVPFPGSGWMSCAGLKLSKIVSAKASPLFSAPLSLSCGLQKYNLFNYRQYFFSIIFQFYRNWLISKMKNFARHEISGETIHLLIYNTKMPALPHVGLASPPYMDEDCRFLWKHWLSISYPTANDNKRLLSTTNVCSTA